MRATHKIIDIHSDDAYHKDKGEFIGKTGTASRISEKENSEYCYCWFDFNENEEISIEDATNGAVFHKVKIEEL